MSGIKDEIQGTSSKKMASNLFVQSLQESGKHKKKTVHDVKSSEKNRLKNVPTSSTNLHKQSKVAKSDSNSVKSLRTDKKLERTIVDKKLEIPNNPKSNNELSSGKSRKITDKHKSTGIGSKNIREVGKSTKLSLDQSKSVRTLKNPINQLTNVKTDTTASSSNKAYPSHDLKYTVDEPTPTALQTSTDNSKTISDSSKHNTSKAKSNPPKVASPVIDYEDDFESYESDFEEYSSSSLANIENGSMTESTESLTSSSDENIYNEVKLSDRTVLLTNEDEKKFDSGHFDMSDYKNPPMLSNIREAIEKENTNMLLMNNPASLSDEGFEDQKSLQFVNFLDAQKKCERDRDIKIKKRRGVEILNMIKFNYYSFTLIDIEPVSYDVFLKYYGTRNTVQISTQTENEGIDEDIQTNEIICTDQWTQQPEIFCDKYNNPNIKNLDGDKNKNSKLGSKSLKKFMISASKVILKIQEEVETIHSTNVDPKVTPFKEISHTFNTNEHIFVDSYVSKILLCDEPSRKVITIHIKQKESLIAVWKSSTSKNPEVLFICYGNITSCSFGVFIHELIFTGLEDGAILLWGTFQKSNIDDAVISKPTLSTAINNGHTSKVIAVHLLNSSVERTNELCSLDEDGNIILWTIILKYSNSGTYDNNEEIVLVKNTVISLKILYPDLTDILCTNFVSSPFDSHCLYISTNYGFIIHHLMKNGRTNIRRYLPNEQSFSTCLEICPFSGQYFLVGYDNGTVLLFSTSRKLPLISLSDKDNKTSSSINLIQWSKNKSALIYTVEGKNKIHIWDLNESDMFPIYSIQYKEEIKCMKISGCVKNSCENPFMLIGTNTGNLYLHHLNERDEDQTKNSESIKTFFNYVKML